MRFEVRYLVVFKPGSDGPGTIAGVLKQVYGDSIGDSNIDHVLKMDVNILRSDGQSIVTFQITDERAIDEAESIGAAFSGSLDALLSNGPVEHILKLYDSLQCRRHQHLAEELYRLEMRLREAISFIFIDSCGENYYNLLKGSVCGPVVTEKPTEQDYRAHQENEFFFILFDHYMKVNDRKFPAQQELIRFIGEAENFDRLREMVAGKPVTSPLYTDFLAKIKEYVDPIEKLRNCVAHNRSISPKVSQNYERAKPLLHSAIDKFFLDVQKPSGGSRSGDEESPAPPSSPPSEQKSPPENLAEPPPTLPAEPPGQ